MARILSKPGLRRHALLHPDARRIILLPFGFFDSLTIELLMDIGAFIIGDELLSGKRQDKHLPKLIELLAARGLKLAWAQYLGDNPARLLAALRHSLASGDLVFSFGGIGATPDDHTRACAAAALDAPLAIHPEGRLLVEGRFGDEAYPHRINMVNIPEGSRLIPNPVNQMPGFSVHDHHFVPGFPSMAWPMVEWVLDTQYRHLFAPDADIELTVMAEHAREGDLIDLMQQLVAEHPAARLSSLPSFGTDTLPPHIEFGFTGQPDAARAAMAALTAGLQAKGYVLREVRQR